MGPSSHRVNTSAGSGGGHWAFSRASVFCRVCSRRSTAAGRGGGEGGTEVGTSQGCQGRRWDRVQASVHVFLERNQHLHPQDVFTIGDPGPVDKPAIQNQPLHYTRADLPHEGLDQPVEDRILMRVARHDCRCRIDKRFSPQMQRAHPLVTSLTMCLRPLDGRQFRVSTG